MNAIRTMAHKLKLPAAAFKRGVFALLLLACALNQLAVVRSTAAILYADTNDCEVQWTLTDPPIAIADLTTTTLLAGTAGTTGKERCPVIPFQLPNLGAVTNPFFSASFSCNIASYLNTPVGNADLYGLNRRAAATVLTNDFWGGTNAVDPTDATFLQGNILLEPPSAGIVTSSGTALVNYLNAQYAGGAGAGQFVFLRLSTDAAQSGVARWQITSAEGGAANINNWPQINFVLMSTNAPVDTLRVETRADGAGVATPATNLSSGMVLTNFSIARSGGGVFLGNLPAIWMLTNVTGSIASGDLVAAADGKSARFIASGAGSARVLAVANATNLVASGVITVTNTALYTDTGSPTNPPWSEILPALNVDANDPGPVYGSLINVNNAAVEVGLYGHRPISIPSQRIHVACNTSTANFLNFTRWFQTDGNTQVLRVFVDDENTATARTGTSLHNEAFMAGADGWNYTDNVTYEWTGHYTLAYLRQSFCGFQLKNSDNDWAFQLSVSSSGSLTINNRTGTDVLVTNADGTTKRFNGGGFDMRVLDDGLNYKVWIDGVLYGSGSYSRPTGTTTFRWGMYFGADNLNPPADYNMIFVSGPQIKSWPGNLATPTTTITKTNNTTNLNLGTSWVGGVAPGLYNQAVWDSTVTAANTTTLASDQQWAGLKIANPGGTVTINGSATLSLDDSGVILTNATQNLVVNCPVQLTASSTWGVAAGRTATFTGSISGYPGFLVSGGGGTVTLSGNNTFAGTTSIGNLGVINIQHASALGSTSGGTSVSQGATLQLQGGISFAAEPLTLASGTSVIALLQNVSGDNTWNGPIGTSGSGQFVRIASDSGLLTLAGTVTGNDPATSVVLQGAGNILVSGKVTGTAGLFSGSTGAGTRTLNNTGNDYGGNTTMSGGTLKLGAGGVIPEGSGKGNVVMSPVSPNVATLDLAGFNETINGLTNSGTGISVVDNTTTNTTSTLTVGGNNQTSTFSGVIRNTGGTLALTKTGSGTLNLPGTNTYSGNTTVNGGTLAIAVASLATNSTVSVAQGAALRLDFTVTNTVAGFVTNGVALASGVYHAGNAAPFIVGNGSLRVAGGMPPSPVIAPDLFRSPSPAQ
jgi:autotransporter-associated beta strand protein